MNLNCRTYPFIESSGDAILHCVLNKKKITSAKDVEKLCNHFRHLLPNIDIMRTWQKLNAINMKIKSNNQLENEYYAMEEIRTVIYECNNKKRYSRRNTIKTESIVSETTSVGTNFTRDITSIK